MDTYVCDQCGGTNLVQDAWVPMNDPEAVHVSDYVFCEDCDEGVDWHKETRE